jgi:UDP-N-acetylglucosamine--N-acetylmuramyl-(pentapeptide) pyrophosphoryl-undecaprenol N-acetylglucosamine transferase
MISIAFTGGGSGGHIYPGLAVISMVKEILPCRVFWIGSNTGMDKTIVEGSGIEFYGIPSGKLRRYVSLKNFTDIFRIIAGFFAARRILKRECPSLLFSKGGFVSVPPCAAAASLKIPIFTHESDYSPGLATRLNARFAEKIFIPYKESMAFFSGPLKEKTIVSGNPIRPEFAAASAKKGRVFLGLESNERVLLVLGGSLGSQGLNALVRACLPELTKHYTVVHQTGQSDSAVSEPVKRYKPYAYFKDEMPHVIAAAELILCRSGAGTIWENKSLNKPMVLVPLPASGTSRGDQVENARLFQEAGAAIWFTEDGEAATEKLSQLIASLANDPEKRKALAEAQIVESLDPAFIPKEIVSRIKEES